MMKAVFLPLIFTFSFVNTILAFGITVEEAKPKEYTEYESQNVYGTYAGKQRQVAIAEGLRPIVDTVQERDKYGNDGGKIRAAADALITKTEGLSATLSNKVPSSGQPPRYAFPELTAHLNRLGGRLLGLE